MFLFDANGPFMRFLNVVADIVLLHFLWLLCSIPIFTIGASTTALYYACMKRIRTGEGYITSNFFHSFKSNFRQSTVIWLILLALGLIFLTDFRYGAYLGNTMGQLMIAGCAVFLIPYLLVLMYIFPVQAKFENRIVDNFKNAIIMALRHFPYSLLLFVIYGTFLVLGFFFFPFLGLLLLCGAGLIGYLTSGIFVQIFRKYLPDELEEDLEKSGETFHE